MPLPIIARGLIARKAAKKLAKRGAAAGVASKLARKPAKAYISSPGKAVRYGRKVLKALDGDPIKVGDTRTHTAPSGRRTRVTVKKPAGRMVTIKSKKPRGKERTVSAKSLGAYWEAPKYAKQLRRYKS